MKIFGLYILTEKQLENKINESVILSFDGIIKQIRMAFVPELERLKNDHWDKFAFDRLINWFKN